MDARSQREKCKAKPGRPFDIILTQVLCVADFPESLPNNHVRQTTFRSIAPKTVSLSPVRAPSSGCSQTQRFFGYAYLPQDAAARLPNF